MSKTKTKTTKTRGLHPSMRSRTDREWDEWDERVAEELMAALTPDDIRELGEAMGLKPQRNRSK